VLPDTYLLAAFVDVNGDGKYQHGEPANFYGSATNVPTRYTVEPNDVVVLNPLVVAQALPKRTSIVTKEALSLSSKNIGRVASLDDPIFSQENVSTGLWKPVEFLNTIGAGLFLTSAYQQGRTPVLFIHGANGGPGDWKRIVEAMDGEKFQPFMLYYPSGLPLEIVTDYLVETANTLHRKYAFGEIFIIAHSMGGLVARSYVSKHLQHGRQFRIAFAMTINSPMGGMPSAAQGVKYSPIVVPSWRDVAAGSEFLMTLHAWQWPATIPYHLVFSYEEGEGNDGVVPLQSQIPLKLQAEASRMYGFNSNHAGILTDETFVAHFNRVMENSLAR